MRFQRLNKTLLLSISMITSLMLSSTSRADTAPAEKSFDAPRNQTISIKMIGPVTQTTDLQIICVLKHDPAGDKYIEAMDDFNKKLGGLLSRLREQGEFAGDLGETLLFIPPPNSVTPKLVLLIGIGDEADLSTDRLRLAGTIAARESTRLKTANVSFAPTLRDQGSNRVDVGEGDAAFATGWILAYDTEKKLQEQGLSAPANITALTIEAGPKFFDGAAAKVEAATKTATEAAKQRTSTPYASN